MLLNKVFFGKSTALKLQLNQKQVYIHMGLKKGESEWSWDKLKMNDAELGEIIQVLRGQKLKTSFFHSFGNTTNKIWLHRTDSGLIFKVNEVSKNLTSGEQEVLRVLLERCIWEMNRL